MLLNSSEEHLTDYYRNDCPGTIRSQGWRRLDYCSPVPSNMGYVTLPKPIFEDVRAYIYDQTGGHFGTERKLRRIIESHELSTR